MEKLKNPSENYNGRDFIKYNINNLDEDRLKLIGFTKKEIKLLMPYIGEKKIRSNVDLEKVIWKRDTGNWKKE